MRAIQSNKNQKFSIFACNYKGYIMSLSFDQFNGRGESTRGEIRVYKNGDDVTQLFSNDGHSMLANTEQILEIAKTIDEMQAI